MIQLTSIESKFTGYGTPVRIFKSKFRTVILCLFFLLSFSSFKYLPGMLIVQDIFTGLVLFFLVLIYPFLILTRAHSISRLEFYGLLILIIVPPLAAYMAYTEFGQPYLYGLLAQRALILIGCSMMFIYMHRRQVCTLEDVERALLWLAWFSLIASTLANLLLNVNQLGAQAGFSTAGMDGEDAKLLLDTTFIIYGFFYYAFTGFGSQIGRRPNVYFSLLFFAYLVFSSGGRSALVAITLSYVFFVLRWRTQKSKGIYFFKFTAAAVMFGLITYVAPVESLTRLQGKFEDAINVVLTGKEGNDVSANARILEVNIAAPYIDKHLILGNGFISNQWHGGFHEVIGYFHPSDIGLMGVIFEFGVLGLVIFSGQIYFLWKYGQQLPINVGRFHRLSNAIKGFMLYLMLSSLTTGRYAFLVEQSLLFITLLYCITKVNKQRPILRGRL